MSIRDERKQQSRQALLDAALQLSTAGRSFSSISLREVAREVGLVPTAFYRHFQDMDALGQELVDQVALHIKSLIHQLGQSYLHQAKANPQTSIELFVQAVNHSPLEWQFMIAERWGGSTTVRYAIAREIEDLTEALTTDLSKLPTFEHFQENQDLKVLSTILINMSFTWAMTWLSLSRQYDAEALHQQQQAFIESASTQVRLIFRGVANWE
ncbi:TetR family transcriptional regulator [Acinetobacter guerrae]|uniref:TetR family transcriptional regulator n=1 Tax=Acinetobacter guerrae TaxID=1843371 RepID=A0A3A8EEV7_9GAMM|nr:TetR family transcriptional regulator [Acinetobacter guerrae]RKG33145.1 TetR family transcriptional regulator [Acinetobacter guerrae]